MGYATIVQGWVDRTVDSDWWDHLTSATFSPRTTLRRETLLSAEQAAVWLGGRRWPDGLNVVRAAIENFALILTDLTVVLSRSLDFYRDSLEELWHEPYYKMHGFNPSYDLEVADYTWTSALFCDLSLELCRAANEVCAVVIEQLDPLFRIEEGYVTVVARDLVYGETHYRAQYRESDKSSYNDVRSFAAIREHRDSWIGSGVRDSV